MGDHFGHPAVAAGNERGQAIVEAALVMPLLLGMMLAVAQYGIAFTNKEVLQHAASVGAYKGALVGRTSPNPAAACQSAARAAAPGLKSSLLTVTCTASPSWTTAGADVTVTLTYPYSISLVFKTWSGSHHVTTKDIVR